MTVLNYGLGADFLRNWVKSFVVALVVIPLALRAIPSVSAAVIRIAGIKHTRSCCASWLPCAWRP